MAPTAPILWLAILAAAAARGDSLAAAPDSLQVSANTAAAPVHAHPGFVIDGTTVRAVRLASPVTVDGVLSEPAWQEGGAFTALVQRDPTEGAAPSQRTEVRIAYDDDAIYIGARLYD